MRSDDSERGPSLGLNRREALDLGGAVRTSTDVTPVVVLLGILCAIVLVALKMISAAAEKSVDAYVLDDDGVDEQLLSNLETEHNTVLREKVFECLVERVGEGTPAHQRALELRLGA